MFVPPNTCRVVLRNERLSGRKPPGGADPCTSGFWAVPSPPPGGADQWWILGTYPALQQGELTSAGFRGVHTPPPGGADQSPSSAVFLQFTENPHEIGNKKLVRGVGVGGGGMNQNPFMFYHHYDDERFWDRLKSLPFLLADLLMYQ